jgi:hypothetical protein
MYNPRYGTRLRRSGFHRPAESCTCQVRNVRPWILAAQRPRHFDQSWRQRALSIDWITSFASSCFSFVVFDLYKRYYKCDDHPGFRDRSRRPRSPYQGRPRTFCLSQIPENRCDQRFAVFDREVESDAGSCHDDQRMNSSLHRRSFLPTPRYPVGRERTSQRPGWPPFLFVQRRCWS